MLVPYQYGTSISSQADRRSMAKKKAKKGDDAVPFEDALEQIQQIAHDLEDGSLGLEDSLKQFETGVRLIRQCHETLEQAEQRIRILTDVDAEGNPVLADFDATATLDKNKKSAGRRKKAAPESNDEDSDEFSLF